MTEQAEAATERLATNVPPTTASALRALAAANRRTASAEILVALDAHLARNNGSGPDLHVVFNNYDMENRDDLDPECAIWEMDE